MDGRLFLLGFDDCRSEGSESATGSSLNHLLFKPIVALVVDALVGIVGALMTGALVGLLVVGGGSEGREGFRPGQTCRSSCR